ncbi:hypothetical protein CSB37_02670 [bacterium DOLZORAL124_38_8]|nr:MAG: hypothetical protein CSB37_02670 [bacterium DOLZORAL124_38_8]
MKKIIGVLVLALFSLGVNSVFAKSSFPDGGEWREFTLTGYYSPLPNQPYFLTGSYESEIRLNGRGKHGADGTIVYPGMIAAPKNYAFGTSICLPNFGCGKVHDRGGAIVNKGQRKLARHDRLDLWMGYGEAGLLRALSLGVKHVKGKIYPHKNIPVAVNFTVPSSLENLIDAGKYPSFEKNLSFGSRGEEVKILKQNLQRFGIEVDNSPVFDEKTKQAVLKFQLQHYVIENKTQAGAGIFGPKTRSKLAELVYKRQVQQKITELWNSFRFEKELKKGNRSADVVRLQQLLIQKEFLQVPATGYFGPKTKRALTEFQLSEKLIASRTQFGAGLFGPKTRKRVNQLLSQKKKYFQLEQSAVTAYQKVRNHFLALAD